MSIVGILDIVSRAIHICECYIKDANEGKSKHISRQGKEKKQEKKSHLPQSALALGLARWPNG